MPGKKRWIAAATLLALALSAALSAAMEEARLAGAREKTRARAESYAAAVSFHLHASLHPAFYVEGAARDGELPGAEFRSIADAAFSTDHELTALAFAEGSVVRHVAPPGAAFPEPGLDLFRSAETSSAAIRSRYAGQTSIVVAPGGGAEASARAMALLPISIGSGPGAGGFLGFTVVVIDLPGILADAGLAELASEAYDYRLVALDDPAAGPVTLGASRGALAKDPVRVTVLTEGGSWILEAAPAVGWIDPAAHALYALAAFAFGSLAFALSLAAARYLESERRYRLIAENASDVIWTASFPDLRFTYLSPSFEQLTGYPVEEALGQPVVDALPDESAELLREAIERRVPRAVMGDPAARSGRSEYLQRRKDGGSVWVGLETTFIADRRGRIRAVLGIARDIDERKKAELELAQLATTDPLTGLANRRLFFEEAARELARAARSGTPTGFVMMDLDRFKALNDAFGHQAGDRVLATTARAIRSAVRLEDLAGRYGGEEFALLLPGLGPAPALALAERLRAMVEAMRFEDESGPYGVTASFGVAAAAPGELDLDALVAAADAALYEAKRSGRNLVRGAARP